MRPDFLPFSPPLVGSEEIDEVIDTLRSDWLTTGPKVERFQREFAEAVAAPAALAVNSCTAAMHVGLAALGVGPGDAVITTDVTFSSTVHVIEHQGARPIIVDVQPDTLNIDPEALREALRSHPEAKAVMPVHLYGHPAQMDTITEVADAAGVAVLEDAAHALPAALAGWPVGRPRGPRNLVAFSFYATKNLTTGEGGMLTGSEALIDEARTWSLHGMSRDAYKRYSDEGSWRYDVIRAGFKYNLPDILAAIGIPQLHRLPEVQRRRVAIVAQYDEAFGGLAQLERPARREDVDHAWHIYAARLNLGALSIGRSGFIDELRSRNIGSSVHFIPIHELSYYRDRYSLRPEQFPVASREFERLVSLPLSPRMTDTDVGDVIEAVRDICELHSA